MSFHISAQVMRLAAASGAYQRWKTQRDTGVAAPLMLDKPLYLRLETAGCDMKDIAPILPREAGKLF